MEAVDLVKGDKYVVAASYVYIFEEVGDGFAEQDVGVSPEDGVVFEYSGESFIENDWTLYIFNIITDGERKRCCIDKCQLHLLKPL